MEGLKLYGVEFGFISLNPTSKKSSILSKVTLQITRKVT